MPHALTYIADTDPYPWPYDGDLSPRRLGLVICGAQPHWATRSTGVIGSTERLIELAGRVRRVGGVVIWIRHGRRPGVPARPVGPGLPEWGTLAWQLSVEPVGGDWVVDAGGIDGTYGSSLVHDLLQAGRDRLLLGGLAADACVDSTLRSLNDQGFECLVLRDAYAPLGADTGARALASVTMSGGIFGALGTAAAATAAITALSPSPTAEGAL